LFTRYAAYCIAAHPPDTRKGQPSPETSCSLALGLTLRSSPGLHLIRRSGICRVAFGFLASR